MYRKIEIKWWNCQNYGTKKICNIPLSFQIENKFSLIYLPSNKKIQFLSIVVVAITGNIHGIKHAYRCVSVGNKIDHYKNKLPVLLPNIPVFITHLKCSPTGRQEVHIY